MNRISRNTVVLAACTGSILVGILLNDLDLNPRSTCELRSAERRDTADWPLCRSVKPHASLPLPPSLYSDRYPAPARDVSAPTKPAFPGAGGHAQIQRKSKPSVTPLDADDMTEPRFPSRGRTRVTGNPSLDADDALAFPRTADRVGTSGDPFYEVDSSAPRYVQSDQIGTSGDPFYEVDSSARRYVQSDQIGTSGDISVFADEIGVRLVSAREVGVSGDPDLEVKELP